MTGGPLVLAGGALSAGNAAVYGEIVRRAGGGRARIGVVTAASVPPSEDPLTGTPGARDSVSDGRFYAVLLERHGAGAAEWVPVDVDDVAAADRVPVVERAASMTGFFFGGGDQSRLVTALVRDPGHGDSGVLAVVRACLARGGVVAGTSAGAQIQAGRDMVTGGESHRALRDGARPGRFEDAAVLGYLPAGGFGLFTGGLVDTHFGAYGRLGRAVRLAADTGHVRVFGLDPDTAAVVEGGMVRVLGRGGVSVLDLRAAVPVVVDGHWAISGVRWSLLPDGSRYGLTEWAVERPAGVRPVAPADRGVASPVRDVFDVAPGRGFTLTRAALDLACAGRSVSVTGTTLEADPRFEVTLAKDAGFSAFGFGDATGFTGMGVSIRVRW